MTFSEAVYGSPKACDPFLSSDVTIAHSTAGETATAVAMSSGGIGDTVFEFNVTITPQAADGTVTIQVCARARKALRVARCSRGGRFDL